MVYEFNRAPMSESTFHSDRQGVRDLMTQGGKDSSDPPQSWRIKILKNYKDMKGGVYRHHILIVYLNDYLIATMYDSQQNKKGDR